MKRTTFLLTALLAAVMATAQTLNVQTGQVTYQVLAQDAGDMTFGSDKTLTILDKTYSLSDITQMTFDDSAVADNTISIIYSGTEAQVVADGKLAALVDIAVRGAHVAIVQHSDVTQEISYVLSGASDNGSFYMNGQLKATLVLNGLQLNNPDSAAINIRNGKRIAVELADGTVNTLTDGTGGTQKACFAVKGHTEFKGGGTLNITGNTAHAFWGKEYVQLKKTTGTINILGAVGDGMNVNQYFQMNGGTLSVKNVGDDAVQVSYETDDDGTVVDDADNLGQIIVKGGTLDLSTTANAAKALKAGGNVVIEGGNITVSQTGGITVEGSDVSYVTAIRAGEDVVVTGGTITIENKAAGGKGISAEGDVTIDESVAAVVINITASGAGGVAETTGDDSGDEEQKSYKVYVSIPTTGGGGGPGGGQGRAWTTVYLYKSDGTLVQQLTQTVTKTSGYTSTTFYYYDFGAADTGTYYFKSDNYTSRNTTYTIRSANISGPTSGSDYYYSITNSYTTSGTTRTYTVSNVTNTYGGTSDTAEDEGTGYNAIGIKADGNLTVAGGTITVTNSGAMSKSVKSKHTVTINGGTLTLTPSGTMQVINSDASYSSGVKCDDFILNDGSLTVNASGEAGRGITAKNITTNGGTLKITNSGNGKQGTNDSYTAKGLKADTSIKLLAGTISITMSGTGGKGIKSAGTYTQGTSGGDGPTLTVNTTGSSFGSSSGGGGFGPGQQSSGSSSAKAIKVQGTIYVYGGTTEVTTKTDGAEGLESKTAIYIEGGQHYFFCYDDCINSAGNIYFNGGVTVCYSNGNDAVDSNAGRTGAITIGNGAVFAYTSKGSPEEGLDCDNNSYIQITGKGIAISAGGSQGGGGGMGGSSGNTISNAAQGYNFVTSTLSYSTGRYYTLADSSGKNLVTYSFAAAVSSSLALITATGMTSGSTYTVKYSTTAPTDATTAWHGLYLGSSATGTTQLTSFTAK